MFTRRNSTLSESGLLVLVTGANGFIGSHLTEALLGRGYRVRCMVRRVSDLTFVRDLPVEWVYADVRDAKGLRQACQDVDTICHCAALTRALDLETFLRVNTEGTGALARAAIEANPDLQRFVFVSSQTVAGPSQSPGDLMDESRSPQPLTWYAKSKWAAEQALLAMNDGLPLTIIRPAAVYGPRDRDFFAYFELVKRGLQLELGRDERWYSLIYVRDLVELVLMAMEKEAALGQTYFACTETRTYKELSQAIADAMNRRPLRITLPEAALTPIALGAKVQARLTGRPALLNEQRVLDIRHRYWLCSGDKARQELGFVPHYDLHTAVRETANWYWENGWL